jgi:hypothetical protein
MGGYAQLRAIFALIQRSDGQEKCEAPKARNGFPSGRATK